MAWKNYTVLSLINVTYQVLSSVLLSTLNPFTEEIIGNYQWRFRANRVLTDNLFTIRQLLEKSWKFNKQLQELFIDFQQACAIVIINKIWKVMTELGIPLKHPEPELEFVTSYRKYLQRT